MTVKFSVWVAVSTDGRKLLLSGTSLEIAQRDAREVMGLEDGTYHICQIDAELPVPTGPVIGEVSATR